MTYGFEVFIDESGDEGFRFRKRPEPGSSEWFVLSAVVVRRQDASAIIGMMRDVRRLFDRDPTYTLHFVDLGHDQRVAWVTRIAGAPVTCISILIHKSALTRRSLFRQKDRMYFYATRLLIERVSWLCRDHHAAYPAGDGTAKIIFSKRKSMRYEELRSYFSTLWLKTPEGDDWLKFLKAGIRIHWPAIRIDQVVAETHHKYAGLQVADAVASGMKQALEYSAYGHTEHRFAKLLKPVTDHRPKARVAEMNYLSYGVKFFPSAPKDDPTAAPRSHWIEKYYSK
jgi:hypothetical protein